ncbi:hypothetical protein [Cupriavidus basilensis]|jgi:hypothetical protein|nr:hypothetical protein [Cupriavidus basilensis]MDF3883125.1 hypothetical protein [Cupriavidus basilensis]
MDTINEVALKERQTLGALVYFRVVEEEAGKFQLCCRMNWQESEILLITQRKRPRTWSSLDSLFDYIDKTYGPVPTYFLRHLSEEFTNALVKNPVDSTDWPEGGGLVD